MALDIHQYLKMGSQAEGGEELKAVGRSSRQCPEHQVTAFKGNILASKAEGLPQTNVCFKSIICLNLCKDELGLVCLFSSQPLGSKPGFQHGTENGSSSASVKASVCL